MQEEGGPQRGREMTCVNGLAKTSGTAEVFADAGWMADATTPSTIEPWAKCCPGEAGGSEWGLW